MIKAVKEVVELPPEPATAQRVDDKVHSTVQHHKTGGKSPQIEVEVTASQLSRV